MYDYLNDGFILIFIIFTGRKFFLFIYQLFLVKQIIGHYCNFLKVKQESYLTNFW